MKKILAAAITAALMLALSSCGGEKATVSEEAVTENASTVTQGTEAETGSSDAEEVAVGNKITTDFAELTITEAGFANSMKTSIKTGNVTRTFGPNDSNETDFAFVKGKIMNKSTSNINEGIMAIAKVGEYTLESDHIYVYKSDGDTVNELSPLVEYNFMMCVEIPNALIESKQICDFNFGFNESLENVFAEFKELDYKYTLKINPEA